MERRILDYENLLEMLDDLLRERKEFWENFYKDRKKIFRFLRLKDLMITWKNILVKDFLLKGF
ncbi:hypothetical protein FCT18_04490 [Lysinibacillus sphaericus]|uniref:Uncharacterized protein n=1 Tax=Lysinibacillus sphaericus TaxID=1421 RepID=A0A2S5CZV9_LYSSH|nr:hypothetical protein [Lysinibacillus sphaericus]MED4546204.1 hypothetical protein [Lysinibacillus sphaericus]POZ56359.1 hypothetical protein LYSIN_01142 [Lysinibacillus sphaericus]TKI20602.1 hypothetical protein FCT18_04490 [Lysinibacillus sphaericus]SUV17310.1 Uncharacterised protein [Lysinibacillus sphaericus]GEC84413.1 hypothetical protein LSP03_41560 [Lysinibacillus sphaericus]